MSRSKYAQYLVGLTLLVGLGAWFWGQFGADKTTLTEHSVAQLAQAKNSLGSVRADVSGAAKEPQTELPRVANNERRVPSALYDKFKNAKDLGAAYAELTVLAKTDPEAQYLQGKILEVCTTFQGPTLQRLEERIEKGPSSPERKAAAAALALNCKGVPAQASKVSSSELIREAASRGDAKSKAYLFRFEDIGVGEKSISDTNTVRELALSQDPVVLNNLDGYFQVRNNKLLWTIPGVEGTVSGAEMANAFKLVACDLGYDCSITSMDAQIACAYRGYCDGDRVAQIQNNLVSPTGFNRLQEIRKAILLGFSTGRWPDGFWSGTNGLPRK